MSFIPPPHDCPLCPRLADFRKANRVQYPAFFNGPVPSFGSLGAEMLITGLAPGLKGANQTGRPFTGDYAGLVLYESLLKFGFAEGVYNPESLKPSPSGRGSGGERKTSSLHPHPGRLPEGGGETRGLRKVEGEDSLRLKNCRITNSVRCLPPQNKPEPSEIKTCNSFLKAEIKAMPNLKVIVTLGLIAHKAALTALGYKQSAFPFTHGGEHELGDITLLNTYHCSRYNINTGRLTQAMFDSVIKKAASRL